MNFMGRIIFIFCFQLFCIGFLVAQKTTCPCHDCPIAIEDGVAGFEGIANSTNESVQVAHANIFNVLNNDLSSSSQCVKAVHVTFKHDYVGDVTMFLVSPAGQEVQLIGPWVTGSFVSTSNTTFEVSFLQSSAIVDPGEFGKYWDNDQDWATFGKRTGSFYPHNGDLEDFNQGGINGTWSLRVHDSQPEGNDLGELMDFSVEFCDPTGLVCDPCEEEKEMGIPCVFQLEGSREQITPIESVCVDVVAQNVAFLEQLRWSMEWDPTVVNNAFIQNVNKNIPEFSNSNFTIDNNSGTIDLFYQLPPTDTLGAVVADSSVLFQVCFTGAGEEGDSTLLSFQDLQIMDIEGIAPPTDTKDGAVVLTVDLSADCKTAKQLCGKETIQVATTKGPGFEKNEGGDCWNEDAETQSKWYQFDILQSGTLEFMIQPLAEAGFRYILFKDGCEGEAVACYPGGTNENIAIGLSDDSAAAFGVDGKFSPSISVEQGESYFLVVDNKGNNSVGFNLEFAGTCEIGDQDLKVVIEAPPILNCKTDSIILNTSGTKTGDNYQYQWTIDGGNFRDSSDLLAPVLDKAGTYTLKVTDTNSKCSVDTQVKVDDDFDFPIADAGEDFTLSCTTPIHEVDGSGSSQGDQFSYDWSFTSGGNIIQKIEPTNASVNRPSTYILTVINTNNSCTTKDSVVILESMDIPDLSVTDQTITCTQPMVETTAISNTAGVVITWMGEDMTAASSGTNFSTEIPGIYEVTATAPNGCTKVLDYKVSDDRNFPTALAGVDFTLTCERPVYQIAADSSSQGNNFEYEWRTDKGHFINEEQITTLTPQIDSAGLYILKITDTTNGCEKEDSVLIDKDFVPPRIVINSSTLLTCFEETITIDATASDAGAIYDFQWAIQEEGNIASGEDTYEPVVDKGGIYTLNITNTETGCSNNDSVIIDVSQDRPNIKVTDQTISCTNPIVDLQASSDTAGVTWEWTSELLTSSLTEAAIMADIPGEYTIAALAPNGCTARTTVTVADDRLPPQLTVSNDSTLTCSIEGIEIAATSTTNNTSFKWLLPNGDSSNTAQVVATMAGDYIQFTEASNGCISTDTVVIANDENAPVAVIEVPDSLSCDSAYIALDASANSSQGANFLYSWSTTNGEFSNDASLQDLTTRIAEAGTYQLTVLDQSNDCETSASVEVTDIRRIPTLILNKPTEDTLNCLVPSLEYSVNTNAEIPTYRWSLEENQLATSDTLLITEPGNYRLQIIDESNNCTTTERINITIDTIAPIAEAGNPQELNCSIGEVTLNGTQSSQGNQFSYIWTDEPGATISTSMETEVTKEGLYRLTVVNTQTGCRSQDMVAVIAALDNPIARAGNDTIYCRGIEKFELLIGTDATSQGDNFSYQWQVLAGELLGNEHTQLVTAEGTYILNVVNKDNNCQALDSITITEAPRPKITIQESGGINCRDNLITYTARSDLPNTAIRWDGQEVFEDTILRATDALAGATYVAFVVDETTGCENQSGFITILPDRNLPIVRPGVDAILNCQDTIVLDGSFSQKGPQYQYTWTTETGNIISSTDSLIAMADAPGTYTLTIVNTDNFCSDSDFVHITDNRIHPEVSLPTEVALTCTNPTLNLGEGIASTSPVLYYTWRNQEGNILDNRSILSNISTPDTYILQVIDSFNLCTTFDSVLVIENKVEPTIELEETKTLDCTNPTTILSATTAIEGLYEWSTLDGMIINGGSTLNAMVNAAGTYRLTVENSENGCSSFNTIQVIDNQDRPEIDAGNNTAITCYNDTTVQLIGSIQSDEATLLLEWTASSAGFTPISDSLTILVNQPGTYYLTATNPNTACIETDSVVVDLNIQAPTFSLENNYPTIDCRSPELTIGSTTLLANDTLAFQWTTRDGVFLGPDNTPEVIVGAAGNYTLAIINVLNGCASQEEVTIEAEGGLPTVSLGEEQLITCNHPEVQIGTDSSSIGNNFDYQWTRDGERINQTERIIAVQEAGNYQLTILNMDTGCEASATVQVAKKNAIEGIEFPIPTTIDCIDTIQTLQVTKTDIADDLSFEWLTLDGNILTPITNPAITVNRPGTYVININSMLSGCSLQDSILVENNQIFPTIELGEDQVLRCDQPSLELSSSLPNESAALAYKWFDADNNILSRTATTSINQAGTYQLEIINEDNGCVSQDDIVILQNDNLPQTALLSISPPACKDSKTARINIEEIIGGIAPYDIQLDGNPAINGAFENLSAGTYTLTIQDSLACEWDTLIPIEAPAALNIQINASADQLFTGDRVNLSLAGNTPINSIAFIEWQPAELFDCSDCAEQTVPLFSDTQVEVAIMDENGCEGFATTFIEVRLAEMPNAITPNGDGMNDALKIPAIEADPDGHPDNEIVIFNRWGDVVYQASPYRNDWNGTQNGQTLPEGTYYYVLRLDVSEGATMKGIVTILK